ncbi:3-methyl-2-oxobutanoate hydroxymethyltransferase [Malassezia caprae]|uniref:3-methyl-2-oxobutanoate hydroxymethyltransferase n=1 Tax=Malassezia caprae TaxID=1381934 RepID=A0AAF0IWT3_9BASI|nr:3-methyl-2-oxobutanoate hydroxymethyltransferase [Malassezia caprae]
MRALHSSLLRGSAWAVAPMAADQHVPAPPITRHDIQRSKDSGTPLVCITAFDYPTGLAVRGAGADMCLVGDSLANVALGYSSTRALTLDASIHHAKSVHAGLYATELQYDRRCPRAPLMIVDMPFGSFIGSMDDAVMNATRVVKETQAAAIKMEGSMELVPLVERLTSVGIDVVGHIGLQPQHFGDAAGFKVQGTTAQSALSVLHTALALEKAGCFSLVIECVPAKVGAAISQRLRIPTIGIGAGPGTHGQVLVCSDVTGDLASPAHVSAVLAGMELPYDAAAEKSPVPRTPAWPAPPKFVRCFSEPRLGASRIAALRGFTDAVRDRTFPDNAVEAYRIKSQEWAAFERAIVDIPLR